MGLSRFSIAAHFVCRVLQKRALLLEAEFANIVRVTYGESTHHELRGLERREKSPITSSSRARSFLRDVAVK